MVLQSPPETQHPKSEDGGGWIVLAFAVLAAAYLPTRLVEEANPEWRLVSWALALVVVGLTWLLLARTGLSSGLPGPGFRAQHAKARLQTLAFSLPPLAFFLVAVPLPTVIEAPLIRGLTAANTAVTVEVVNWLGVAAVQQGNTIQVVTGSVGIDEACSGIRSFQVALMLALFFGEVYRLKPGRRVALCVVGLALSFVFNVARTTLLTCVAASQGVGAVASWHDPAGAAILVGCFLSILLIARRSRISEDGLGGRREETKTAETASVSPPDVGAYNRCRSEPDVEHSTGLLSPALPANPRLGGGEGENSRDNVGSGGDAGSPSPPPGERGQGRGGTWFPFALLLWLVFSEGATELWYRAHELRMPPPVTWSIALPRRNPTLRELPLADNARRLLRYDEAVNASWEEAGRKIQAIFLRWNPGRTAVYLARNHTPEACVTAVGHKLVSKSAVRQFQVDGLELPFRGYVFQTGHGLLHVYYCLWEDRAFERDFDSASLTRQSRLAPVAAGRRLLGQRSLELAIWGCPDAETADTTMRRRLETIVVRKR